MKNRLFVGLAALAACLVASAGTAFAEDGAAYSSSAVGVMRKTLPQGKLVCMSIPLDQDTDAGEGYLFANVPAISNMPNLSVVNFWDAENQRWVTQSKTTKYGWGAAATRRVTDGEAFFIKQVDSSELSLVISGDVPPDPVISQGLSAGNQTLVANPYPVPVAFTNLMAAKEMEALSVVSFWDEANQRWVTQSKTAKYGWGAATNRVVEPGEGFFLKPAGSDLTWQETRPYTWPK